jgi:hypothetical protein
MLAQNAFHATEVIGSHGAEQISGLMGACESFGGSKESLLF